jgi:uncharacterized protein (TIGR03435 family)
MRSSRGFSSICTLGGLAVAGAAPFAQAPANPSFEVASVKRNTSGTTRIAVNVQPGGRFTVTNMPLRTLIMNAYQLQSSQLIGAPDWIATERFDIVAKMAEDTNSVQGAARPGDTRLMLRSLLAERFRLEVHNEQRELAIYALVVANKDRQPGASLRRSDIDCVALAATAPAAPQPPNADRPTCGMRLGPGRLTAGAIPLSQFANALAPFLERIVINRTELAGNFDIDLSWTPEQVPQGLPPPRAPPLPAIDPNGPSIFTAVPEQLGLKLESTKGPVDVLVIDHVEQPTPD